MASGQQFETGFRRFIGKALGLALLDDGNQRVECGIVLFDLDALAVQFGDEVRLAALVGDHQAAAVADAFGINMLIGIGCLEDCRGMDTGLGGKSRRADIGRLMIGSLIDEFVELVGNPRQFGKLAGRHADLETAGIDRLQGQGRYDRRQIGIAAALADTIERSLHLTRARFHRCKGVGHCLAGIVMGVNAEVFTGNTGCDHGFDDFGHFRRLRTAIGIAQHDPPGACFMGGLCAGQRILGIGLVAIEEMLAVDHGLTVCRNRRVHRACDGFEVFLIGAAQRHLDVIVPTLGNIADGIAIGGKQTGEAGIVGGRYAMALGHAEADKGCFCRTLSGEKFGVGRIGTGIAALNIVDAQFIEHPGNVDLVSNGKVDTGRLLAIAQRRVEKVDAFAGSHPSGLRPAVLGLPVLAALPLRARRGCLLAVAQRRVEKIDAFGCHAKHLAENAGIPKHNHHDENDDHPLADEAVEQPFGHLCVRIALSHHPSPSPVPAATHRYRGRDADS